MSQVIERFCIDVKGSELKEHAARRAAYHSGLAKEYSEEIERLKDIQRRTEEETKQVAKFRNDSSAESLENNRKGHERRGRWYKFVSEHLVDEATYRLYHDDQVHLEIAPDRY